MLIYKITNNVNGKIYVGQELKYNPRYFGSGLVLIAAIKKYGIENFQKEILENFIEDKEKLNEREIFWIKKLNSRDKKIGYNIASGGQGGDFLSEEQKEKRGKKISEARKGKKLSEMHKEKIKEGIKKVFPEKEKKPKSNYSHFGESNSFYGKKHTGDMSRFSTRSGISPTNALKIRDQDGNIYNSASEAAKQFENPNVARRAIADVCRGKRKDYKGKIFRFI